MDIDKATELFYSDLNSLFDERVRGSFTRKLYRLPRFFTNALQS